MKSPKPSTCPCGHPERDHYKADANGSRWCWMKSTCRCLGYAPRGTLNPSPELNKDQANYSLEPKSVITEPQNPPKEVSQLCNNSTEVDTANYTPSAPPGGMAHPEAIPHLLKHPSVGGHTAPIPPAPDQTELESQIANDLRHSLKLMPASQRELFSSEVARYIAARDERLKTALLEQIKGNAVKLNSFDNLGPKIRDHWTVVTTASIEAVFKSKEK